MSRAQSAWAHLVSHAQSAWCVIRRGGRHGRQMLRWLLAPLVKPTPGAWIVATGWTFGVVLLTEHVFTPAWWFFFIGTLYLAVIIIVWAYGQPQPLPYRIVAFICTLIACGGAWFLVQYVVDIVEAKTYVAVEFKNAPFLTAGWRKHIRRDLTAFHDYLTTIGFDIPKKVPFLLGTTPKTAPISVSVFPDGIPGDAFTKIPERDIVKDDVIQAAYARFVFGDLLRLDASVGGGFSPRSPGIFSSYYVSSYRHINRCGGSSNKWCHALWDIRQRYGQEFADKLLFYVLQQWQPATTSEKKQL